MLDGLFILEVHKRLKFQKLLHLLRSHVRRVKSNVQHMVNFVTAVCYAELLFQRSFLFKMLHAEIETNNVTEPVAYHGTWPILWMKFLNFLKWQWQMSWTSHGSVQLLKYQHRSWPLLARIGVLSVLAMCVCGVSRFWERSESQRLVQSFLLKNSYFRSKSWSFGRNFQVKFSNLVSGPETKM